MSSSSNNENSIPPIEKQSAQERLSANIEALQRESRSRQIKSAALSTLSDSIKAVFLGSCYGIYHGLTNAPKQTKVFSMETFLTHFKQPILRFSGLFGAAALSFGATRHTILQLHYPHYTSLSSTAAGAVAGGIFGHYAFDPFVRSTFLAARSSFLFACCATAMDVMVMRYNHENYWRDHPDLIQRSHQLSDDEAQILVDLYFERARKLKEEQEKAEESNTDQVKS
jgi:hypothetical protein